MHKSFSQLPMFKGILPRGEAPFIPVFLFLLLPVIWLPAAFDPDLTPRLVATSAFAIIASLLLFRTSSLSISRSGRLALMINAGALLWAMFSARLTLNSGVAIAELARLTLLLIFFLFTLFYWSRRTDGFAEVSRLSSISILLYSVFAVWQTLEYIPDLIKYGTFHIGTSLASSLSNKNFFTDVLTVLLPVNLFGVLKDERKWKVLHIIALALLLFYLFFLQSLASWLAVGFSFLVFLVMVIRVRKDLITDKQRKIIVRTMFLVIIAGVAGFASLSMITKDTKALSNKLNGALIYIRHPELLDSTTDANSNSSFDRMLMWRNSIRMIRQHPFAGIGLENWRVMHASYGVGGTLQIDSGYLNFEHPHNEYLFHWAEQGLPGLLLFLSGLCFVLYVAYQKVKSVKDPGTAIFILLAASSVLSYSILCGFSYPHMRMVPALLIAFLSAAVLSFESNEYPFKKSVLIITLIFSIISLRISISKLNAEIRMAPILKAHASKNYARLKRESEKAQSYFTPYDYTTTSFDWYIGLAEVSSGMLQEGKTSYLKALEQTPYHIRLLNDLGSTYERLGEYDNAIEIYNRVLKLSPSFMEAKLNKIATLYNKGDLKSAMTLCDEIRPVKKSLNDSLKFRDNLYVVLANSVDRIVRSEPDTLAANEVYLFLNNKDSLISMYLHFPGANAPAPEQILQLIKEKKSIKE